MKRLRDAARLAAALVATMPPVKPILGVLWHPLHFGMQRRQLLNLKRRLEAAAR